MVELLGGWRDNDCTAASGQMLNVKELKTRIWTTTTCHCLRKLGGCNLVWLSGRSMGLGVKRPGFCFCIFVAQVASVASVSVSCLLCLFGSV